MAPQVLMDIAAALEISDRDMTLEEVITVIRELVDERKELELVKCELTNRVIDLSS
jgi:hypothetical protein